MIKPVTATSVQLLEDDRWIIEVLVTDDDGKLVDELPAVTVTSPSDVVTTPVMTRLAHGKYRAALDVSGVMPIGLWVATVKRAGRGVASFNALVMQVFDSNNMPDIEDCKAYAPDGLASWTDPEIASALNSEAMQQRARCEWSGNYPDDLSEALCRRVMLNLAWRSRTFPTDVLGDAEVTITAPANDPVVRRLEAPYRTVRLGR